MMTKQCRMLALGLLLGGTGAAWTPLSLADAIDGVDILKREERRAQELKDIEYQTLLLERKARLAKAYQELQAHGGFVPDLEFMRAQEQQASDVNDVRSARQANQADKLPVLRRIEGYRAHFETDSGVVVAGIGANLPGGYRVVSVSMERGVELERAGIRYRTDIDWN